MILICEQFAAKYDLTFNGSKSKLIIFSKNSSNIPDPCLKINGNIIEKVDRGIHLGNILNIVKEFDCIDTGTNIFQLFCKHVSISV